MRKPCCDGGDTNKGAWTKQEDEKLIKCINTYGEGCWRFIPKAAGLLRCGKSCRLRWINYLRPDLKRGNFGEDEEDLIIKLHALLGNRWSLIAGRLPGRTDNEVKNYWNTHLRRKLLGMGLDPNNQKLRGGQHRVCENITSFSPCCSFFPPSSASAVLSAGGPFGGHARHQNHIGCNVDNDVDGVSDTASSMEDDKHALPDLNLDLTISTPSPRETRKLYEPFGVAQERE